jgi:hypothetical protein
MYTQYDVKFLQSVFALKVEFLDLLQGFDMDHFIDFKWN